MQKTLPTILLLAALTSLMPISTVAAQDTRDAELSSSDQDLNEVYKAVMKRLGVEEQQHLKTAQRAWIQMRDADCEWAFVDRRDCLMDRTDHRMEQLKQTYFQDKDGNYESLDSND